MLKQTHPSRPQRYGSRPNSRHPLSEKAQGLAPQLDNPTVQYNLITARISKAARVQSTIFNVRVG